MMLEPAKLWTDGTDEGGGYLKLERSFSRAFAVQSYFIIQSVGEAQVAGNVLGDK